MDHIIASSPPLACGWDLWLSANQEDAGKVMAVAPVLLPKTQSSQENVRDALLLA